MVNNKYPNEVRTPLPTHTMSYPVNKSRSQHSRTRSLGASKNNHQNPAAPTKPPTAPSHQHPQAVAKVVATTGAATAMEALAMANATLGPCRSGWSRAREMSRGSREVGGLEFFRCGSYSCGWLLECVSREGSRCRGWKWRIFRWRMWRGCSGAVIGGVDCLSACLIDLFFTR